MQVKAVERAGRCLVMAGIAIAAILGAGCARQQPVAMAPPVQPVQQMQQGGQNMAPGGMQQGGDPNGGMQNGGGAPGGGQVGGQQGAYGWQDVPVNQQVPITRAVFDQGGYQLYAGTGDTIAIPFANQNMYVLKFGQSGNGGMYFVNDGSAPTLYVPRGGYLENASAQGAHWYPFSQGYNYTSPVYIGIAPTWNDYMGMGWYPGMMAYGGYWGYHPYGLGFAAMPGLYFNIGGTPYYGWNSYHSYYYGHPYNRVYVSSGPRYNYSSAGRSAGSFGRNSFGGGRSTGSFGRSSGSFGSGRSTGSFGRSSNSFGTSSGSFGRSSGSGSFGSGRSAGSFGSGSSGFGSSSRRSSGSFGGGTSGFGSGSRSFGGGGSSFGGGSSRSFGGGSFGGGGGSRSFGGGSFGGGGRSFGGGSFGGGRRR